MKLPAKSIFILIALAGPDLPLRAQADAATTTTSSSLWSMIEQGGWAMFPLGACSLALIYLAIHCLRETKPSRFGNEFFNERVKAFCENGKLEEAIAAARHEPTLLGRALAAAPATVGLPESLLQELSRLQAGLPEALQEQLLPGTS